MAISRWIQEMNLAATTIILAFGSAASSVGPFQTTSRGGGEGRVGKWMNPAATSSWSHPRSGWCETASARVPPLTLVPVFPGGLALWLAIYWSSGFKKPSSVMIGRFNLIQTFPMFAFAFISIFDAHFVILCLTREHSGI